MGPTRIFQLLMKCLLLRERGTFVFGIIMFREITLNLLGCFNNASSLEGHKDHAKGRTGGMQVDLLVVQTSISLSKAFLDQPPEEEEEERRTNQAVGMDL